MRGRLRLCAKRIKPSRQNKRRDMISREIMICELVDFNTNFIFDCESEGGRHWIDEMFREGCQTKGYEDYNSDKLVAAFNQYSADNNGPIYTICFLTDADRSTLVMHQRKEDLEKEDPDEEEELKRIVGEN